MPKQRTPDNPMPENWAEHIRPLVQDALRTRDPATIEQAAFQWGMVEWYEEQVFWLPEYDEFKQLAETVK